MLRCPQLRGCRCACHELGPAPDLWALFYLYAKSARCGDTLVHIPCTARNAAASHANTYLSAPIYNIYLVQSFLNIPTVSTTLKLEPLLNSICRYLKDAAHPPVQIFSVRGISPRPGAESRVCGTNSPVCDVRNQISQVYRFAARQPRRRKNPNLDFTFRMVMDLTSERHLFSSKL